MIYTFLVLIILASKHRFFLPIPAFEGLGFSSQFPALGLSRSGWTGVVAMPLLERDVKAIEELKGMFWSGGDFDIHTFTHSHIHIHTSNFNNIFFSVGSLLTRRAEICGRQQQLAGPGLFFQWCGDCAPSSWVRGRAGWQRTGHGTSFQATLFVSSVTVLHLHVVLFK